MEKLRKDRAILHCDLNNFFASVEVKLNPALAGRSVAVCGNPEERKGIVLAKCEIAKKFGVKTGDTVWMAKQKCPGIEIVIPKHHEYSKFAKMVQQIYYQYTDMVEPFGIDECWLDVTGSERLFGDGPQIARTIRDRVAAELGLTISVGVSWNKTYAKIASDLKKPNAITVVTRENYQSVILSLPVESMLFIGRKTKKLFEKLNIMTIGDLAAFDIDVLRGYLGITAEKLVTAARGDDVSPVSAFTDVREVKSVGNGTTVPKDLKTVKEVTQVIYILSEEVATRLRRKGFKGFTVNLGIRDTDLSWCGAQESIRVATNSVRTIQNVAMNIFAKLWVIRGDKVAPIHSMRVSVSNLTRERMAQLDLFSDGAQEDTNDKLSSVFDKIRRKHGTEKLAFGTALAGTLGLEFEVLDEVF